MNNNSIIAASIILPSIIISITLLLQKRKVNHTFLATFYMVQFILLTLSSHILSNYKYMNLFPLGHIGNLFTFCMAPTIYLYIKKHLSKSKDIYIRDLLHFLPFIIILLYYLYMVLFQDIFYGKHNNQTVFKVFESTQTITYYLLLVFYIKRQVGSIREFLTNSSRYGWLTFLISSSLTIFVVKLYTFVALEKWGNIGLYFTGLSIYMVSALAVVTNMVFIILSRPKVLLISSNDSGFHLSQRVLQTLKNNELYIDDELNLSRLSAELGNNEKEVSRAINENFHKNYYQLVNELRIEKCIQLMSNPGNINLSITDFQYKVGFSSKSSFFTNFKSYTGYTPLQYKKMLKISS